MENTLYYELEFFSCSLDQFLIKGSPDHVLKKKIIHQIVKSIASIHSRGIIHRDLKPQNIYLTEENDVRIGDFNLARNIDVDLYNHTHGVVTLCYRSPELLMGTNEYSTEIDMWAIGCIFAEIYKGEILFYGNDTSSLLYQIFSKLGTPDERRYPGISELRGYTRKFPKWSKRSLKIPIDEKGNDLLQRMLCYDPKKRINAKNALAHPFFEDMNSE